MSSARSAKESRNRYHLASNGVRMPRMFPPDVQSIPLSPSLLESPMFRDQVTTLVQQGDTYAKKLDSERRRSHEIDLTLQLLREEHFQAHKALCIATNSQSSAALSDQKSIEVVENRLDQVLSRYNKVCNFNKCLRDQIQTLRREKVQQAAMLDKLERETAQTQIEVAQAAQASQAATEARDRSNRQSEALRNQIAEDGHDFESGWLEKTGHLAEHRTMIRDIARLRSPKSPTRAHFLSSVMPTSSSLDSSNGSFPGGIDLSSPVDLKLRDETEKNERLLHEKTTDLHKQSERLRRALEGLAKIKRETGEKDSTVIAAALLDAEEKNFSLFNMINELSTEMEALEVENNALEFQVKEQTRDGLMGSAEDARRRTLKQQLEDEIERSRQKVTRYESRYNDTAEAAETIKTGAMGLFHKLQTPNDEGFAAQLAAHGVTDILMVQLLGLIEQRVGELVDIHNIATLAPASAALGAQHLAIKFNVHSSQDWSYTRHSRNGDRSRAKTAGMLLRSMPPTADDFADTDNDEPQQDEVLRPYKIADIQEKTQAALNRRKEKQARTKR